MMNTLHILTQQDSKFMGGVGQEFRNTLEQIAVEGVGQNNNYIKANWRELVPSNSKNTD